MAYRDTTPPAATGGPWRVPLALILIALITLASFWQVLQHDFISYDDNDYVTVNMAVRQGLSVDGIKWAFSAFHAANWHPLTWLSHMLDVELFGLNPAGHHGVNLALHLVNALLLFWLLQRWTGFVGRSLFVALLFAVHPLHVESVAWVAERKDLLSTLFWLLTMWAYAGYARTPSLGRYLTVVILFALGLMAKQMLVTLPLVLLLMDYWPLSRFSTLKWRGEGGQPGLKLLLAEKIPLLALSLGAALITLKAQESGGALLKSGGHPFLVNAGNAVISYAAYIGKMFWPAELALFYPFDPARVTALKVAGAVLLLAALTLLVLARARKRPYLVFGWFWYLVTLIPVIGFVKVGGQSMADRYTYVPLIGLFLMLAWGGGEAAAKWRDNGVRGALVAGTIVVALLSLLTVRQVGYWRDSYGLYQRALAVVEENWLAHNNMGILLAQNYRQAEALYHFQESVRINPQSADGFRNLGNLYQMAGRNAEALEAFRQAVRLAPGDAEAHFRLGYGYLMSGNPQLAYQEYQQLMLLDQTRARALMDSIRLSGR